MEVVFVILHYIAELDTCDCVSSIINNIDTDSYHIIIVDNASHNKSGKALKDTYCQNNKITVLLNEDNLGFSRGLNVGIKYAREYYFPKYIVACNNDIQLLSENLVRVLDRKYDENNFAVAGPMMITKDGQCSVNPIRNNICSKQEAINLIRKHNILIMLCHFRLYKIYEIRMKWRRLNRKNINPELYLNDQRDYQLHGAFLVFSKLYFEKFDGLDEGTFLYGEENLLYLHLIKNSLHTLYTPEIRIFHKEDSSTDLICVSSVKKILFTNSIENESMKYYIKVFENYEK